MSKMFLTTVCFVSLSLLCSVLYAQSAAPARPQVEQRDVAFEGKFDRLSGEVKLKGDDVGLVKEVKLENALGTLERKGFSEEGLERLRTILSNTYQGGEEVADRKPAASDAIVEIKEMGPRIKFKVSNDDLTKFNTVEEALGASNTQSGCQKISKNCVRCPNGKIYCYLTNLVK